jgi:hypothetical protein
MGNKDTSSLFVLLLILLFCLSHANSALGEEGDSVFHYVKPDWWSEALWPNGFKKKGDRLIILDINYYYRYNNRN